MDNKNWDLMAFVVYGQQNCKETNTEMLKDLQIVSPDNDKLRKILLE